MNYAEVGKHRLISFIIPVYNVPRSWAQQAFESVLAWSMDVELIVIDDGSTDRDLVDWMVATSERDSRVRYIRQANAGVPSARNAGFRAARGEWITFFDADDIFAPNEAVARALRNSSTANLVVCAATGISADGDRELEKYPVRDLAHANALALAETMLTIYRYGRASASFLMGVPWAKFYSTAWLRDNDLLHCDPRVLKRSDAEWLLRVFAAEPRIESIDESVVAYRFDAPGSNSKGYRPGVLQGYLVLRDSALAVAGVSASARSLYWVELVKDAINAVYSNPAAPAEARTRSAYLAFRDEFDISENLLRDGSLVGASLARRALYVVIRNRWFLPIRILRMQRSIRGWFARLRQH